MSIVRRSSALALPVTLILVAAGCGSSQPSASGTTAAPSTSGAATSSGAPVSAALASAESEPAARSAGARITARGSAFGRMLWGPGRRAVYIFERDGRDRSRCYGECAELWPPVYTSGRPQAGDGVRSALLGSIRRKDGRRQVTYAGQPLYYYAHESAGQVLCHNVDLNGGLWWVVGPNGKRRP